MKVLLIISENIQVMLNFCPTVYINPCIEKGPGMNTVYQLKNTSCIGHKTNPFEYKCASNELHMHQKSSHFFNTVICYNILQKENLIELNIHVNDDCDL